MTNATKLSPELIESYETEGYENRQLSRNEAIKMLDLHGVKWHIQVSEDKLFADDGADVTEINNWSLFDMLAFLNY